eukprot:6018303-Ditylum_brightwellii.AAC.1
MMTGQGFLVLLLEVYFMIKPHLKGVHLTLESWHPDRDVEGLKYTRKQWLDTLEDLDPETKLVKEDAPELVNSVPQLCNDLYVLKALSEANVPPLRPLRGVVVNQCT